MSYPIKVWTGSQWEEIGLSGGALAITAPPDISASGAVGSTTVLARADHTHGFDPNEFDLLDTATASATYVNVTEIPVTIGLACSDETTDLTTASPAVTFRMPHAMNLTTVRASVNTAPVGSSIIVDINEAGSSILSTKLSIDASEKTSTTAASAAVISDSSLADDSEITIDIDQIGSSTAGAGLKVWLIGTRS